MCDSQNLEKTRLCFAFLFLSYPASFLFQRTEAPDTEYQKGGGGGCLNASVSYSTWCDTLLSWVWGYLISSRSRLAFFVATVTFGSRRRRCWIVLNAIAFHADGKRPPRFLVTYVAFAQTRLIRGGKFNHPTQWFGLRFAVRSCFNRNLLRWWWWWWLATVLKVI